MNTNWSCCDCGAILDTHDVAVKDGKFIEDETPLPGDGTLCVHCGGLNIFAEQGGLRRPTDDEYIESASNSDVQRVRAAILLADELIRASDGKDKATGEGNI